MSLVFSACVSEQLPSPTLEALEPAQGVAAKEVPVTLRGQGFYLAGQQQLRGDESLRVEDSFVAWLDDPSEGARGRVMLRGVEHVDTETLRAVVPAGIAVGEYTVVLVAPHGTTGLERGYRALPGVGPVDGGTFEGGMTDAATTDAEMTDAGMTDAAVTDAATTDAAVTDAAVTDAAVTDAATTDAEMTDAGDTPTPSGNIDPAWIDAATTSGELAGVVVIDTDLGLIDGASWPHFHVTPARDCGGWPVEVGVFAFTTLHVQQSASVRVRGSRAVALVASGAIAIEGVINLTGGVEACTAALADPIDPRLPSDPGNWCAGPGGFAGGGAENPGALGDGPGGGGGGIGGQTIQPVMDESGGGGGGHGGAGGAGGDALDTGPMDALQPGGAGGGSYDGLVALCGGSGGGGGGAGYNWDATDHFGQAGGGGGGAIQIFSRVEIELLGAGSGINAGGGGGGADLISGWDDGGGGGGSGGTILLEAPTITLSNQAALAANGGGGGGASTDAPGEPGDIGQLSGARTPAGLGGGLGGAGAVVAGQDGQGRDDGAGGGGGGAGQIHVNTGGGDSFESTGTVSPRETQGEL